MKSDVTIIKPDFVRGAPGPFLLACLLVPIGVGVIVLLAWWIKVWCTELVLSEHDVTLRTGLLTKRTTSIRHSDIRMVDVQQGILQRAFDSGHVSIASAAHSGVEIYIGAVASPFRLKARLDSLRDAKQGGATLVG